MWLCSQVLEHRRERIEVCFSRHPRIAATLCVFYPLQVTVRHCWRNLCRKKVGRGPRRRPAPFLWASASHSAVPGRPPHEGRQKEAKKPDIRGQRCPPAHPYWRGRVRRLSDGTRREGGPPWRPRRHACAGTPPARSWPPKGRMRGRKVAGRALGASSRGAVCRSARLAPSPGRAGPYRLSALAAGVGNSKSFRWRRRPGLKHTHADATGRTGTFRHAAQTMRRDGSRAPAGPRPAARAQRGACGGPLRLDIRNQNIRVSTCQFFSGFT